MTEKEKIKKFVDKYDFTEQGIDEFVKSLNITRNKLAELLLNELNDISNKLSDDNFKVNIYFYKLIKLITIIVNSCNFNQTESKRIKLKIKNIREKLLALYNNSYVNSANALDELIVDKNNDVSSLLIIIKELINRHEDTNIIKKFVASNKETLIRNNCELFDIAFNKALASHKKSTDDIYYYITLLKIFYI